MFSFLTGDVRPFIADRPIDATIGTEAQAMHVVARISDMGAEAGDHQLLHVSNAVAIGIF